MTPFVSSASAQAMEATHSPERVLIVDDHRGVRVLLRRLIEAWGYACVEAEDGVKALDYASTHDVAFIVTDFNMPNLDGFGLVRTLRESEKQKGRRPVPVILVTGSAPEDLRDAAYAIGINAILPKPVVPHSLRAIVDRILQRVIDVNESDGSRVTSRASPSAPDFRRRPEGSRHFAS